MVGGEEDAGGEEGAVMDGMTEKEMIRLIMHGCNDTENGT